MKVKNVSLFYLIIKRMFDIFSSLCVIIVFSPILLLFSILVKLTSKGPVIFKDKRVGLNGKIINVWKYRSMYVDAESNIDKYLTPEQKEVWFKERKLDDDPRITKLGKFMRITSIDELPQLFNILYGTMSVVGPRPITERELEQYFTNEQQKLLLAAKPGLLSYWGVTERNNIDFDDGERQKRELEYFSKRSFWFDFKLILLGILAVLKHKGAK